VKTSDLLGCYLCQLSVVDALVLGTMMGTIWGKDESELRNLPGRRPILLCAEHIGAVDRVNKERLARWASLLTGREVHVQATPRWLR
jgi:hypothetical protein